MTKNALLFMGLSLVSLSVLAADFGGHDLTSQEHDAVAALFQFNEKSRVASPTVEESFRGATENKENMFVPQKLQIKKIKPKTGNAGKSNQGKSKAAQNKQPESILVKDVFGAGPAQQAELAPVKSKKDWVACYLLEAARKKDGSPFAEVEKEKLQKEFDAGKVFVTLTPSEAQEALGLYRRQYARCLKCHQLFSKQKVARGHYLKKHCGVDYWVTREGTKTRDPKFAG